LGNCTWEISPWHSGKTKAREKPKQAGKSKARQGSFPRHSGKFPQRRAVSQGTALPVTLVTHLACHISHTPSLSH
jgi:hypothetical protein